MIAPGAAQAFTVGGGKPCYSTSSSNQNVARAAVIGGTLTITGLAPGSAEITVSDAAGSAARTTVTVGTGTGTGGDVAAPSLSLGLVGGGNSIAATGFARAQASVKDANGAAVVGKLVTFSGDATMLKFSPASGQALTNSNGVASIEVAPFSLSSAGASTLSAKAKVGSTDVSTSFDFQMENADLGLSGLVLGVGDLAAYGSRAVSVLATINGQAATASPVQVTFNASCGSVLPSVVTTDAGGAANTTYTADLAGCAGTKVTISAAAVGASTLSGTLTVAASLASNVLFVSTSPQLLYLKGSVGTTQAQVVFRVVDASANPLPNQKLRLALSSTATGVSINTGGNMAPVDLSSNSAGEVSVAVFSGTVPTSLNVSATLLDTNNAPTAVSSNSNQLTVASGRPSQKALSLALEKLSIEAFNRDGETVGVTLSMADRQGNPVPAGTQVNFVTESGVMLPATCTVPAARPPVSSCSVTLRSSGTRSADGLVSILAYVVGEEDFVDINGNNVYDAGEPFTDLGLAYRDDNGQTAAGRDGKFSVGEFRVLRGVLSCAVGDIECVGDGLWGAADVRQQTTLVFATSTAKFAGAANANGFSVTVSDLNNNSVPTGSSIDVSVTDHSPLGPVLADASIGACTLTSVASIAVTDRISGWDMPVALSGCTTADVISFKVTTPIGSVTVGDFVVP